MNKSKVLTGTVPVIKEASTTFLLLWTRMKVEMLQASIEKNI